MMLQFWGCKLLQYILVLVFILALNFSLPRMMPGSPMQLLAGEDVGLLSQAERAEIMARHGLDQPIWRQFAIYLGQLAKGDLGYSYRQRRPVGVIIRERLPWTLLLTGSALVLSAFIGVVCGTLAAWRRGRFSDLGTLSLFIFLDSMPSFWLGMILVALFGARLRWFPVFGAQSPFAGYTGWAAVLDVLHHLALPLATLTLVTIAGLFLTMRYSTLDVLGEQYITVARAKGLPEGRIVFRHVLRNALLPVITVFMLSLGFVVSGATVVETVFTWPGLGRLMFEAVLQRDYPVLQATFMMVTVCVIAANLAADLLYPLADPRVRVEGRRF
ncbi:MAG: ABC transporter permease [Bacillota bacterium]